ncbi:hypothetical protein ACFFRR_010361 [Megaselia abdita]
MMKITALFSALLLGSFVAAQDVQLTPQNLCLLMANGTQIADQTDCTLYYQCIQGTPIAYSCPTGTMYNKDISVCTIPSQSTCASINSYCQYMNGAGFVADPISCNGYYYCDGTSAIGQHSNCPSGENFNPNSQACAYANTYSCGSPDTSNPVTATPEENEMCTLVPSNTYFGVSTDCTAWAECVNGVYSTGFCPSGFEFNTANGDCDYISNVVCQQLGVDDNGNPVTDSLPPAVGGACTTPGTYTSDGATCNGFYWCSNQLIKEWGSCDNNYFFDAASSTCVDRSKVLCTVGNVCVSTESSLYTWVNDPTNCQKYYYCQNNQESAQSYFCDNGEYFNQVVQACTTVQPTYAACAGAPVPPTASGSSATPGSGSTATPDAGSTVTPGIGSTVTTDTGSTVTTAAPTTLNPAGK